jgi:hypothetical protein
MLPARLPNGTQNLDYGPWLFNVFVGAAPMLTQSEFNEIEKRIQAGQVTPELENLLMDRRAKALEAENIENGEWIRSYVADQIIANNLVGTVPAPFSGKSLEEWKSLEPQRRAKIDQLNADYEKQFRAAWENASHGPWKDGIFWDGFPAFTLTYGNDYRIMRREATYRLRNGDTLTRVEVFETPFNMIDLIRKDPTGHVYEKLWAMAADSIGQWALDPLEDPLRRSVQVQAREGDVGPGIDQHLSEQLAKMIDDSGVTLTMQEAMRKNLEIFMQKYQEWSESQRGKASITQPFIPPVESTAVLNCLPSPYEMACRRDAKIDDILREERQSQLGQQVLSGDSQVIAPQLIP